MTQHHKHLPLSLALLGSAVAAQDARSTLAQLVREAASIGQVRVLDVQSGPTTRTVRFKTVTAIKGQPPRGFILAEPSRQACGSALHGVIRNSSYLAFLTEHGGLVVTSARALVPLTPQSLAHVRALTTATGAQRLQLLTESLDSTDTRIRLDAAVSLAHEATLETMDLACRAHCRAHLQRALRTHDVAAASLIQVAIRLKDTAAVDTLVTHYLGTRKGPLDPWIERTVRAIAPDRAVRTLENNMPTDIRGLRRGIALLHACGTPAAARCLGQLANHENPVVASIARSTEPAVTPESVRRTVPRFRSILQGPRR